MKRKLLFIPLLLLALSTRAQSPQIRNVFMDSVGVIHISPNLVPQVAISGYFSNLLSKPTTLAGYGITDGGVSITAGNGISITGSGTSGSPYVISEIAPTITQPTRTLNSNFTINTTHTAIAFYTISVSVQNPLLAGTSVGNAFLEYSLDGGTTWKAASSLGNSSNVGITVTVQLTNLQTGVIGGIFPANALERIRTTTSGTATVTFVSAEEIYY